MSKLKATPGPWLIGNESSSSVDIQIGETLAGFDRENLNTCEPVISREEMLANAHLSAAAPDLYEALEALLETCHAESHGESERRAAIAALYKARGEL